MKVTLVQPPMILSNVKHQLLVQPPLGMAYVGACLREAGHTVRVVDGVGEGIGRLSPFRGAHRVFGLTIDEIVDRIEADTDVIGVGIMFSNFWPVAKALIRSLRARFPRAAIVCGGEHVTALPRFVLEDAPVDYAVIGEGEETALELVACLAGTPDSRPLEAIAGLAYRSADGSIATTPRRQRRRGLDRIPWPAWDLFPLDRYLDARLFSGMPSESSQRPMIITATRGCPYTCKFCSNEQMWGINYFMRDPKDVVDEMEFYGREYGATDFHFQDLTLVVNGRWVHRLCDEIIARNLGITWKTISGTRSEALDRDLLVKMSRSGCDDLVLAPESGSPEIGRITRKRVKLEKILSVARLASRLPSPMRVAGLMIIGYPEERLQDVLRTYAYVARMARAGFSTVHFHKFAAYPGCEYHDIAAREGRIVHDDEYFLGLENTFPFNEFSWHPRWSGRFIAALIMLAHCVFYGTYYLSRPLQIAQAAWRVLTRRPRTRFERYFALRLWGPAATRWSGAARDAPLLRVPASGRAASPPGGPARRLDRQGGAGYEAVDMPPRHPFTLEQQTR